jgi:hypothetical protein
MPIDAGIYGQFAEPARSTADYQAQYDSQAQRQMQLQQNRLALMQAQQLDKERSGLRDAVQSGQVNLQDPNHLARLQAMFPTAGPAFVAGIDKSASTRAGMLKDTAQAGHYTAQTGELNAKTARDDYASAAKFVMVNPTLDNARRAIYKMADKYGGSALADLQQLEQIGDDPDGIRQWAAGHSDLAAKETLPKTGVQDNGGSLQPIATNVFTGAVTNVGAPTAKMQTPDSVASVGATLEGQKITDKRERELAGARLSQERNLAGKPVYDAERGVVIAPGSATATPVMIGGAPIGAKDKPLTESQGNAAAFAMRAQNALDNLGKVDSISNGDYYKSKLPWGSGNFMMSQAGQQAVNAEKQFIAGVLRKESGAAISNGEYQTYGDQFFPRPGDTPEQLAVKAQNRSVALEGLKVQAGPSGAAQADSALKKAVSGAPVAGGKPSANGSPSRITDDAGYNALPSGATFVGPDGKTRRKP